MVAGGTDAKPSGEAYPTVDPNGLAGKYTFRFNGFSMDQDGTTYYIVGLGAFTLDGDGGLKGQQKSSITQISTMGGVLQNASFDMTGSWTLNGAEIGSAKVVFQSTEQTLTGTFDLVPCGPDRYWMISSGATFIRPGAPAPQTADEVVSGEAVKIGPA